MEKKENFLKIVVLTFTIIPLTIIFSVVQYLLDNNGLPEWGNIVRMIILALFLFLTFCLMNLIVKEIKDRKEAED
jgi:cytochrome bd-type quinol oxidase subunit 2